MFLDFFSHYLLILVRVFLIAFLIFFLAYYYKNPENGKGVCRAKSAFLFGLKVGTLSVLYASLPIFGARFGSYLGQEKKDGKDEKEEEEE